ncbi:MAG: hypothetical protein AAGD07_12570 [Planctomycetota bacterium]
MVFRLTIPALALMACLLTAGCGGSASEGEAPSANEYEAYLAENPDEAAVMSDEEDSAEDGS